MKGWIDFAAGGVVLQDCLCAELVYRIIASICCLVIGGAEPWMVPPNEPSQTKLHAFLERSTAFRAIVCIVLTACTYPRCKERHGTR